MTADGNAQEPPSPDSSLLILIALILVSSFFAACETAFTSLDPIKVKSRAASGGKANVILASIIGKTEETVSEILILTNVTHAAFAFFAAQFAKGFFIARDFATVILVASFVLFLFGDMLPKIFAYSVRYKIATASAVLIYPLLKIAKPFSFLFFKTSKAISGLLLGETPTEVTVNEDDVRDMVNDATQEGALRKETGRLFMKALQFDDKTARDAMIPWKDVRTVPVSDIKTFRASIKNLNYSRIPVTDENGAVLGIVNKKMFLQKLLSTGETDAKRLLLPVFWTDPETKLDDSLKAMSANKTHLSFIRGDGARPAGILTVEDIIEELVGEIDDEEDVRE